MSDDALLESMHALSEADYLDVEFRGPRVFAVKLTRFGFEAGVHALVPDVHEAHRRCIAALVNGPNAGVDVADLAQRTSTSKLVVHQLVLDLQNKGLVSVTKGLADTQVNRVSPTLRRLLD
ncbi:helix-turn-helix domain-containing protein [Nonomuraea fuscirosea]|uniref:helix-turn-helix domain-containing protein n=1 Tax=Nonomuraea fuscirosea TaxID=1291556 RepID=UPI0033DDA81E